LTDAFRNDPGGFRLEIDVFFWSMPDKICRKQQEWEAKAIVRASLG
jgi:hypothetical protein